MLLQYIITTITIYYIIIINTISINIIIIITITYYYLLSLSHVTSYDSLHEPAGAADEEHVAHDDVVLRQ